MILLIWIPLLSTSQITIKQNDTVYVAFKPLLIRGWYKTIKEYETLKIKHKGFQKQAFYNQRISDSLIFKYNEQITLKNEQIMLDSSLIYNLKNRVEFKNDVIKEYKGEVFKLKRQRIFIIGGSVGVVIFFGLICL